MRADAAIDLRLNAHQYVACVIGGQGFIHVHAHTGADRGAHVGGGNIRGGASERRGCKVGDFGALSVENIALLPGQWLGDADHHQARKVLGQHLVVHLDDLAVDLVVSAFRFAKMQLAQASAFAVGEGDLRDVEHDPVIAHVLESPFELHRTHPFEPKAGIV